MAAAKLIIDFVVRDPVCAEPWQPVALVRQQMLLNSFSYLPVQIRGEWKLISDHAIASYLVLADDRRQALTQRIEAAHDANCLSLEDVAVLSAEATVRDAVEQGRGKPVLVVDGSRLLGIATPFDLL